MSMGEAPIETDAVFGDKGMVGKHVIFFVEEEEEGSRDCTIAQPVHIAINKRAMSGADPSVPSKASAGEATREHANALLQEMGIIRDHLRAKPQHRRSFTRPGSRQVSQ